MHNYWNCNIYQNKNNFQNFQVINFSLKISILAIKSSHIWKLLVIRLGAGAHGTMSSSHRSSPSFSYDKKVLLLLGVKVTILGVTTTSGWCHRDLLQSNATLGQGFNFSNVFTQYCFAPFSSLQVTSFSPVGVFLKGSTKEGESKKKPPLTTFSLSCLPLTQA